MTWGEIKKIIDEKLQEMELKDVTFSSICIYDSANSLDIYFGQDRLLCVQGRKIEGLMR